MPVSEQFKDTLRTWQSWEAQVNNKTAKNSREKKEKCDNFTEQLADWTYEAFNKVNIELSGSNGWSERDYAGLNFTLGLGNDPKAERKNWWDLAYKIGSGKTKISAPKTPATEEEKQVVYDAFMPAYRALKEKFSRRSVFQWITNHKEYVTERDALKSLEGVIMTLAGGGKQELKTKLTEFQSHMPTSNTDEAIRLEEERIAKETPVYPVNNDAPHVDTAKRMRPTVSEDFLKVGYVPSMLDIENEWKLMEPLYNAVINGQFLSVNLMDSNTPEVAAREVLFENHRRLMAIREAITNGSVEHAGKLLDSMEKECDTWDIGFSMSNPDYQPPRFDPSNISSKPEINPDSMLYYCAPQTSNDFLKIGYMPDVYSIEKEWKLMEPLYNAIKNGTFLNEGTRENAFAKHIVGENFKRLNEIRTELNKNGIDSANKLLESKKQTYRTKDSQAAEKIAGYVPPKFVKEPEKEKPNEYADIFDVSDMSDTNYEKELNTVKYNDPIDFDALDNVSNEDLENQLDELDAEMANNKPKAGYNPEDDGFDLDEALSDGKPNKLDDLLDALEGKQKISIPDANHSGHETDFSKPVELQSNAKSKDFPNI